MSKIDMQSMFNQWLATAQNTDGLTKSYVKQSTAPRPQGKEGDSLYLWDTKQAFVHDGTDWREV